MGYYKQKLETQQFIEKLLQHGNNFTKKQIAFAVTREKGFSEKFTIKYIDLLIDNGFYKVDKKGVIVPYVSE